MLIKPVPDIVGILTFLSPLIAIPVVWGYFVGCLIRDLMTAEVTGELTSLTLFWSAPVTALIAVLEGGEGVAVGAFVAILLNVAFFAGIVLAAPLAFVTWDRNRFRIRRRRAQLPP